MYSSKYGSAEGRRLLHVQVSTREQPLATVCDAGTWEIPPGLGAPFPNKLRLFHKSSLSATASRKIFEASAVLFTLRAPNSLGDEHCYWKELLSVNLRFTWHGDVRNIREENYFGRDGSLMKSKQKTEMPIDIPKLLNNLRDFERGEAWIFK